MSRCILHGHSFVVRAGVGQFAGREFSMCEHCGKLESMADHREHKAAAQADMEERYDVPIQYLGRLR